MEQTSTILTVKEVADILRCSKTHVGNVLNGKVPGVKPVRSFRMGRRLLIRREWIDEWLDFSGHGAFRQ